MKFKALQLLLTLFFTTVVSSAVQAQNPPSPQAQQDALLEAVKKLQRGYYDHLVIQGVSKKCDALTLGGTIHINSLVRVYSDDPLWRQVWPNFRHSSVQKEISNQAEAATTQSCADLANDSIISNNIKIINELGDMALAKWSFVPPTICGLKTDSKVSKGISDVQPFAIEAKARLYKTGDRKVLDESLMTLSASLDKDCKSLTSDEAEKTISSAIRKSSAFAPIDTLMLYKLKDIDPKTRGVNMHDAWATEGSFIGLIDHPSGDLAMTRPYRLNISDDQPKAYARIRYTKDQNLELVFSDLTQSRSLSRKISYINLDGPLTYRISAQVRSDEGKSTYPMTFKFYPTNENYGPVIYRLPKDSLERWRASKASYFVEAVFEDGSRRYFNDFYENDKVGISTKQLEMALAFANTPAFK